MMIPHQEIRPSDKGERSQSYVLGRITALQREWNALSATERASIAKESCDLTSFFRGAFRNPSIGGISGAHERNVACGIDKRRDSLLSRLSAHVEAVRFAFGLGGLAAARQLIAVSRDTAVAHVEHPFIRRAALT